MLCFCKHLLPQFEMLEIVRTFIFVEISLLKPRVTRHVNHLIGTVRASSGVRIQEHAATSQPG
jgi:hypothetical protein